MLKPEGGVSFEGVFAALPTRLTHSAEGAMIMTEDGYSYSCTTCPKTGQPCAAGLKLARQLGAALQAGEGTIQDDFEITGHGQLSGDCGQDCGVVYSLYNRGFRVFCGVSQDTDPEALIRFSDAFLGDGPVPRGPVPRAMVVGSRIARHPAATARA
ncbi:hypothetical protein [Nioella ostreopsis]|uniref:hypothetical protein n=1 Tax=Nioella ostreopsis TaxID=2448479 RepID=UPI000FDAA25F|nr:hypothetical protein [Nioella ostreopsis]